MPATQPNAEKYKRSETFSNRWSRKTGWHCCHSRNLGDWCLMHMHKHQSCIRRTQKLLLNNQKTANRWQFSHPPSTHTHTQSVGSRQFLFWFKQEFIQAHKTKMQWKLCEHNNQRVADLLLRFHFHRMNITHGERTRKLIAYVPLQFHFHPMNITQRTALPVQVQPLKEWLIKKSAYEFTRWTFNQKPKVCNVSKLHSISKASLLLKQKHIKKQSTHLLGSILTKVATFRTSKNDVHNLYLCLYLFQ